MNERAQATDAGPQPPRIAPRKTEPAATLLAGLPDSLDAWITRYQALAVGGVRSTEVATKIALHLDRFRAFFLDAYGHERISTVGRRDVLAWQRQLAETLAPATVNNHLASLSGFVTWVAAQDPEVFATGNPTAALAGLPLGPLEPRCLTPAQVRSLKNLCDRLERFAGLKGRHHPACGARKTYAHARPWRDRAIVYVLLSTGLRREELVACDLAQLQPSEPARLRAARRARLVDVRGKGGASRTVFLSADARSALADYLERERPLDADEDTEALWLAAGSVATRRPGGRLSARSVNTILERIGRLHDAEHADPERHISPLRPHDLRHSFAFAPRRGPPAPTPTSSSAASGTAPSVTSPATPTPPRTWPPATSRSSDKAPGDLSPTSPVTALARSVLVGAGPQASAFGPPSPCTGTLAFHHLLLGVG